MGIRIDHQDPDRCLLVAARDVYKRQVRALGEIGLDYHYEDNCPREIQIPAFERQLALAKELDIPVIIHTREAVNDTLALLKKYQPCLLYTSRCV